MQHPVNIFNCVIVDDEPLAREVIYRHVQRVPMLHAVAQCSNALQLLPVLQQYQVHLLFLDIQMPEILGTDFIRSLKNPPRVIITTAYPEYALEGYELDVVDYLVKPIPFERFVRAINKVLPNAPQAASQSNQSETINNPVDPYLYFRTDRKMVKVVLDQIVYIEGMKNYVRIITDNGMVITKTSMTAIEAMLPAKYFLRVHRSFIVPKSRIKSFSSEEIGLAKTTIPIGKLYKSEVMKTLNQR